MRKLRLSFLALGSLATLIAVIVIVFRGGPQPDPPVEDPYDFAAALEALERELADAPDASGERYLQAARLARRADEFERAARYLNVAEQRGVEPEVLGLERKLVRAQQGFARSLQPGLADELAGDDAELVYEALTRGLLRAYRFRDAEQLARQWREVFPESALAWHWSGECKRQAPDIPWGPRADSGGIDEFRTALQLVPRFQAARLRLMEGLFALSFGYDDRTHLLEAKTHLQALLERRPGDMELQIIAAKLRAIAGDLHAARRMLDVLVKSHPTNTSLLLTRVEFEYRVRDSDLTSITDLSRRLLELNPHERGCLNRLHLDLRHEGDIEQADRVLDRFRDVADKESRLENLRLKISRIYQCPDPDSPELRLEAGNIAYALGKLDEAVLWWQRALMEDEQYRPAHLALAEHYERSGQPDRAALHRRAFEKANRED